MKKQLGLIGSILIGVMVATVGLSGQAQALSFSADNGTNLAATVDFQLSGSELTVVLTNTSTFDVGAPTGVLTAVFFSSNGTLTPLSASLAGSLVAFGPDGSGNVGGEWAYASGLAGAPLGATQGISSSGLNLFDGANFNGLNLQDPVALDGLQYGITSAGDNLAIGNAAVTGGFALIQNSVTFKLNVLNPIDFTLTSIDRDSVSFQYGTALTEPNIRVPEPATVLLLGAGLAGLGIWKRKSTKI